MDIKRIRGNEMFPNNEGEMESWSNMIQKITYKGILDEPIKKGKRVWLRNGDSFFNTSKVIKIKGDKITTLGGIYIVE